MRARRDDEGAGVVLALGLVAVLVLVGAVGVGVVGLVAAHRQVQAAADLAALAGAEAARSGREPCAVARRIAAGNRGELRDCRVTGVVVEVEVDRVVRLLGSPTVTARARAGPAVTP